MKKLLVGLLALTSISGLAFTHGSIECDMLRNGEVVSIVDAGNSGYATSLESGRPFLLEGRGVDYSIPSNQVGALLTYNTFRDKGPIFNVQILKMNQLWNFRSATKLNESNFDSEGRYTLSAKFDGNEFSLKCEVTHIKL